MARVDTVTRIGVKLVAFIVAAHTMIPATATLLEIAPELMFVPGMFVAFVLFYKGISGLLLGVETPWMEAVSVSLVIRAVAITIPGSVVIIAVTAVTFSHPFYDQANSFVYDLPLLDPDQFILAGTALVSYAVLSWAFDYFGRRMGGGRTPRTGVSEA